MLKAKCLVVEDVAYYVRTGIRLKNSLKPAQIQYSHIELRLRWASCRKYDKK